ncbi:MAG: IS66 family transposase [Parvibaculaceae bacterium]
MSDVADLPDDVEALKAMLRDAHIELRGRDLLIEKLKLQLSGMARHRFGSSAEGLQQLQLMLEDLEITRSTEVPAGAPEPASKDKPVRKPLPDHLPRIDQVLETGDACNDCGGKLKRVGEDVTEELEYIPGRFMVNRYVRPRMACTCCDRFHQAPLSSRPIERGRPGPGLLAHVLVSKYADHLPLYRQAQIFARSGVDLDRSTLAGWSGVAGYHLAPLTRRLAERLKASGHLFMDETKCPVLDPGRGKTKSGYLWALARDERGWGGTGPPGVVYFYADGRAGSHAETFLDGFTGTLRVDAYAGYKRLARNDRPGGAVVLANCWAHARRKLVEIQKSSGSPIADDGLKKIAELYAIEAEIRGLDPEARRLIRRSRTAPLVAAFGDWLKQKRARISAKSRLGEHLTYIANCWSGLQVFLHDGHVEMDSNPVENRIRPLALGRKNHLLAGHDEGAHAWACIASLIETCKLNDVEPLGYLTATLEAIANGHPMSRLDELLPGPFACAS